MSSTHTLRHSLPVDLPERWRWPARPSREGYWMLSYQQEDGRWRARALHLCVAELEGVPETGCWWCGRTVGSKWHIDHVDGDVNNNLPFNLVRVCAACNMRKGRDWWGEGYMRGWLGEVHRCTDRRMCAMGVDPCI